MASTNQPEVFLAVSAATNQGVLTVASNGLLLPGALAWLTKDDGSLQARVKIVNLIGTTQLTVRQFPANNENAPPSYGVSDVSAFNAVASHLCVENQAVAISQPFSVPVY